MKLLLIEADSTAGAGLEGAISSSGFAIDWVRTGQAGKVALFSHRYSAVLLNSRLPDCSGMEVLLSMRAREDTTPVLILTCGEDVNERISGFDTGADDCLATPFEWRELLARIRAVIRRRGDSAHSTIGTETLRLDLSTREVLFCGKREEVSAREFAILHALLKRPGTILSREQLETHLYGVDDSINSNTVAVFIHGIRRRFGNSIISNVRGLGWRIPVKQT